MATERKTTKKSNQEKLAEQQGKEFVIIKEAKPRKQELTEEEKEERLRIKREKDAARKRLEYQRKKAEREAAGETTVLTPDALIRQAIRRQKKYQDDPEYRNKLKEKAREYYHKTKQDKPKKAPKPISEHKKSGRPRKYTESSIPVDPEV